MSTLSLKDGARKVFPTMTVLISRENTVRVGGLGKERRPAHCPSRSSRISSTLTSRRSLISVRR